MRLRNQMIAQGLNRKPLDPVIYELIDCNNVRIGIKWFQFCCKFPRQIGDIVIWGPKDEMILGVIIFHDSGTKQFIANSWYSDIDTDAL